MANYYVKENAIGIGDGSSYVNSMSVSSHNGSSFVGGDVIYLCDTISSQVVIPSSGNNINDITYRGDLVEHKGVLTATTSGSLRGNYKNYITVDGIEVKNGRIAIGFLNSCNYITIKRCLIHDMAVAGSKGIWISSTNANERNSNIVIGGTPGDGNEVYNVGVDTGGVDIVTAHVDTFLVSYNKCYGGEANTGIDGFSDTIGNNGIIEYNEFFDHIKSSSIPVAQFGEDGVDLKGSTNVVIRYNHIYGNRASGMAVNNSDAMNANCSNISIYCNSVHDNLKGTNIVISNLDTTCYVYNNLIYNSGSHGIACSNECAGNVWIYNNTIVNCHGINGDKFALLIGIGDNYHVKNNSFYSDTHNDLIYKASVATNVNFDYNRYYYTNGVARLDWDGPNITLPQLQALGQELNGSEGNPEFTNVITNDFTLASNSLCIDNGANLGASYDLGLDPFSTNFATFPPTVGLLAQSDYGTGWDIGAYVYTTTDPCENVVCPNVCIGTDLYSQKCVGGTCVEDQLIEANSITCGYDPCEGVVCPNVCIGTDLYSQKCDPATGNCINDQLIESNSLTCGFDPCEGVTCPNICMGTDFWSQKCVNGECILDQLIQDNSEICGFDPCESVTCPNVCVGNDLYSQKCDPNTGNCVNDQLIEANSARCIIPTDEDNIMRYLVFGGLGLVGFMMLMKDKK